MQDHIRLIILNADGTATAMLGTYLVDAEGNRGPSPMTETERRISYDDLPAALAEQCRCCKAAVDAWVLGDVAAKDESPVKRLMPVAREIAPTEPIKETK